MNKTFIKQLSTIGVKMAKNVGVLSGCAVTTAVVGYFVRNNTTDLIKNGQQFGNTIKNRDAFLENDEEYGI